MTKVLVVYNHKSPWVMDDIKMLSKHFDVGTFYYKEDRRKKNLRSLVKKHDVIYIWFASYHGLRATSLAKKYNKKVITVASGYSVANLPEYGYGLAAKVYTRWIPRYIIKRSDVVIAVSESNKREILGLYPYSKVVVIPHGFDVKKFKLSKRKERTVITVGTIDKISLRRKGIDKFIETAQYFPEIPFAVIGKVNIELDKFFKKIPANVKLTGFLSDEELLEWYRKAKVYAQFSFHEAFGCSVAEAMLCGCIPVVTDRYALPEVVGDCGFVVNYWDGKEAVDKIEKALNSPPEMGEKARERIVENYSIEKREGRLKELIEETVRK